MGDHQENASVTVGVCGLGQVASLHVASVHPAVQVGTWRKLGGKGGNPVGGVSGGIPKSGVCLMGFDAHTRRCSCRLLFPELWPGLGWGMVAQCACPQCESGAHLPGAHLLEGRDQ